MPHNTILFYNDSEVFGGHEIMTVRIINSLASQRSHNLHCLYHAHGFIGQLDPSVKLHALPFHTKTRTPFMPGSLSRQTSYIKQVVDSLAPDMIVVSQGYAESGVRGLLAARRTKRMTYSYIPFGNNNAELNNRFAKLRDLACKLIYRIPNGYITISNYQASLLQRFTRADQTIHVINNPADFDYTAPRPQAEYAPGQRVEIAVVGRIVFKQKNQHALIPMARALTEKIDFRLHIIGDGPDRLRLQAMINASGLTDRFILHGWMQKPELVPFIAEHIDLLLIPSLYEGLPLILLETLYQNKAFVMSDLGLLKEYDVPKDWLFDPRNPVEMAERIAGLGACFDAERYAALRARVLALHSTERFHVELKSVFETLLNDT